jgi:hypothetical protein
MINFRFKTSLLFPVGEQVAGVARSNHINISWRNIGKFFGMRAQFVWIEAFEGGLAGAR